MVKAWLIPMPGFLCGPVFQMMSNSLEVSFIPISSPNLYSQFDLKIVLSVKCFIKVSARESVLI